MIKKQITLIIVSAAVILAAVVCYFAVVVPYVESRIPVEETPETLEGESLGVSNRYYMYDHLEREDMKSIEVCNQYGSYKFVKTGSGELTVEGFEGIGVDATALSYLVTTCGSTLSKAKVVDNATEEQLREYGLHDPSAYWIVTDNEDRQYKVYVGRELLTGGGYYCMFAGRNSVYVLDTTVENTILAPIEAFITPYVIYGISSEDYYTIDNFTVFNGNEKLLSVGIVDREDMSNPEALVENVLTYPAPYTPNTTVLYEIFMSFTSFTGESTYKLGADDGTLKECGLTEPAHTVSFDYKGETYYFFTSEKTEDGYYYVVSNIYSDIVSKVPADSLKYLDYGIMDWISTYVFQYYITSVSEITVETGDTNVTFFLHHGKDEKDADTLAIVTDKGQQLVTADEVDNFRQYYKALLSLDVQDYLPETVDGSNVPISDVISDDSNRNLKFSYKNLDGDVTTYEFYRYTTRRSAVKINGSAEFYVHADLVQKIINDTARLLNGEPIEAYGKN